MAPARSTGAASGYAYRPFEHRLKRCCPTRASAAARGNTRPRLRIRQASCSNSFWVRLGSSAVTQIRCQLRGSDDIDRCMLRFLQVGMPCGKGRGLTADELREVVEAFGVLTTLV
jgi:hypothetical protein